MPTATLMSNTKAKTGIRGLQCRAGGACSITAGKPPRGSRGDSLQIKLTPDEMDDIVGYILSFKPHR